MSRLVAIFEGLIITTSLILRREQGRSRVQVHHACARLLVIRKKSSSTLSGLAVEKK
jgi:hypothetical protein